MANFSRSEIDEKPKSMFTQLTKDLKPTLPYGLAKNEQSYGLEFLRCATRFSLRCSSFAGIRFAKRTNTNSQESRDLREASLFDHCDFEYAFVAVSAGLNCRKQQAPN